MNKNLAKRTEDALEHLENNMPDEFCSVIERPEVYGFGIVNNKVHKYKYLRDDFNNEQNYDLSLESIREIGQKIGYEVWTEPDFGYEQPVWFPMHRNPLGYTETLDEKSSFYEAMLEALISAIWDKFPKEQQ